MVNLIKDLVEDKNNIVLQLAIRTESLDKKCMPEVLFPDEINEIL